MRTMTRTRLDSSRSIGFCPNALTSVVMFFLASGRDIARMAGLRGWRRKREMSCTGRLVG
jgi:hypothetical protein